MSDRDGVPEADRPTDEEIWRKVGQIAIAYHLLECDKCAIALAQWLRARGLEGTILRLRTRRRTEVFITSKRYGNEESITENGTHYRVEVRGRVFDSLGREGLTRADWLDDFQCISGRFLLEEITLSDLLTMGDTGNVDGI
ncbi:MAG: papain fold toxin domain-containing protein [Cyanobacteria bacterium P01_C01_bin.70]